MTQCSDCMYARPVSVIASDLPMTGVLECHRNAPVFTNDPYQHSNNRRWVALWPICRDEDWCGEYQAVP